MLEGEHLVVQNMRDYKKAVPHAPSPEPEYVQVWEDPTAVWDYDQLDVTVEDDEVLVLEENETVGSGTYVAVPRDAVTKLIDDEVLSALS